MNKKIDALKLKLSIYEKMLSNKSRMIETLVEEQKAHKEVVNPNFKDRNSGEEKKK